MKLIHNLSVLIVLYILWLVWLDLTDRSLPTMIPINAMWFQILLVIIILSISYHVKGGIIYALLLTGAALLTYKLSIRVQPASYPLEGPAETFEDESESDSDSENEPSAAEENPEPTSADIVEGFRPLFM